MKHSKQELLGFVEEQFKFMKTSCESYDRGEIIEAKRLASIISLLVHDTPNSHSLLGQLNNKDMNFYDTGWHQDAMLEIMNKHRSSKKMTGSMISPRLVMLANMAGQNSKLYLPCLKKDYKMLNFDSWWEQTVIGEGVYKDAEISSFTRKSIVQLLRNKVGGSHIDPNTNKAYSELTNHETNTKIYANGIELCSDSPEHATVRQIAFELKIAIEDQILSYSSNENT